MSFSRTTEDDRATYRNLSVAIANMSIRDERAHIHHILNTMSGQDYCLEEGHYLATNPNRFVRSFHAYLQERSMDLDDREEASMRAAQIRYRSAVGSSNADIYRRRAEEYYASRLPPPPHRHAYSPRGHGVHDPYGPSSTTLLPSFGGRGGTPRGGSPAAQPSFSYTSSRGGSSAAQPSLSYASSHGHGSQQAHHSRHASDNGRSHRTHGHRR